jgi:type IV secretory pathway VirB10-like protein
VTAPDEQPSQARTQGTQHAEDPETVVRLQGDRPRVVRLSRKAIALAGAGALALIGGALILALRPPSAETAPEVHNTSGIAVADGLAAAPADYSKVPRLGPPLPGDLGKPILDAQGRDAVAELPPVGPTPVSHGAPDPRRRCSAPCVMAQEREAARSSRRVSRVAGSACCRADLRHGHRHRSQAMRLCQRAAAAGDRRLERPFLERSAEQRTASRQPLEVSPSGAVLQAGSIIPAALITGIRSDQPGLVTAQVTANVYDSLTGRRLLIPQGSRLIGDYDSDVGFGQRRVRLAWNRLILPDGRSLALEGLPATDSSGYAGIEDGVDFNLGGVTKAALVSTLLAIGAELGAGDDGNLVRAIRRGGQDSINRAGEQIVGRELNIRPTLTIRPGFPVRVLVTRDIDMEGRS